MAISDAEASSSRGPGTEAQRCLVDAGLLLGRSFRVGWGPNGSLIHAGVHTTMANVTLQVGTAASPPTVAMDGCLDEDSCIRADDLSLKRQEINLPAGGGRGTRLDLRRLRIGGNFAGEPDDRASVAEVQARLRGHARALLQLHADASTCDSQGEGTDGAPTWSLKCGRDGDLHRLCVRFLEANRDHLLQVSSFTCNPRLVVFNNT